MMRRCDLFLLFLSTVPVVFGCLGGLAACSGGCLPGGTPFAATVAHNRALAAPPHRAMDPVRRAELCSHAGIYGAHELRALATLRDLAPIKTTVDGGVAALSCRFDTADEPCAWYTVVDAQGIVFQRARFEHSFDLSRFECTQERGFPFDDHFLLAGGDLVGGPVAEGSAAIETRIPCQLQKGFLKFNYWSNNDTPVLKICILSEENMTPQCEEAQLDVNPLAFEIPASASPFRLRILVENIGADDIVLIDSVNYQASLCLPQTSTLPLSSNNGSDSRSLDGTFLSDRPAELAVRRTPPAEAVGSTSHLTHRHSQLSKDLKSGFYKKAKPIGDLALLNSRRTTLAALYITTEETLTTRTLSEDSAYRIACQTLTCDFSANNDCSYQLTASNTGGRWRLSGVAVGNPHTGIHRANPNDRTKYSDGFAYVGFDDYDSNYTFHEDDEFVLSSPAFALSRPALLLFDFFQRSMGSELKVCVNDRSNCPYTNPPLLNARHWRLNQQVLLNQTSNKVLFIASKLRRNQYIGVDNVRLIDVGGATICNS